MVNYACGQSQGKLPQVDEAPVDFPLMEEAATPRQANFWKRIHSSKCIKMKLLMELADNFTWSS